MSTGTQIRTPETGSIGGLLEPIFALWQHLHQFRRLFWSVVVIVWFSLLLGIAAGSLSVSATTALIAEHTNTTVLIFALLVAVLGVGLTAWLEQWFAHVLAYRVIDTIRIKVHRAIARLAPLGLARRRSGETVTAAMNDTESLEWFYAHTAAQIVAGLGAGVTITVVGCLWWGPIGLLIPLAQLLLIAVPLALLPRAVRQGRRLRAAIAELGAEALAARTAARETLVLGRLGQVAATVATGTSKIQSARRALSVRAGLEQAWAETTAVLVIVGTLIWGSTAAAAGTIDPASVPTMVMLASMSLVPAMAVTAALNKIGEISAAAHRVDQLISNKGIRPTANPELAQLLPSVPVENGSICTENLRVTYPDTSMEVLRGLDLQVRPGTHVGIVGASGAGKTTLALVLARLIAEDSGTIMVDGANVAAEDPEKTRTRLVLVNQHPHIFRASVRDNLLTPEATDEQIWSALQTAQIADHVRALPEELDTKLAEGGTNWSGGQRQRLGLARGLLRDPSVLVLDEPTAGLDTATEAQFLRALNQGRAHKTTLIITHRPAVMDRCDTVVFLHEGTVADCGTHQELLQRNPSYRSVVASAEDSPPASSPLEGGETDG
ncbi:amino acid ABC transporter ATP-binding/permease protein [Micrococcoides hystricis]|uniref:Amino acid ABC transporter ATP-binding/permease protein n=1 Tax=Micrococcoides hystricis TaxID=1572761 RepID=A0ABV6PE88_9MICC